MNTLKVIANDLIPVYKNEVEKTVVNARELHEFLQVGKDFTNWIKDRIEKYELQEGIEYSPVLAKNPNGAGRPKTEYYLTLDTAKEMAMVENNEQGKKVRKYFIAIEDKARQMITVPKTRLELLKLAVELEEKLEEQQPKVIFAETCLKSGDSILVRELAKIAYEEGLNIGQNRLFEKLREWGHLMDNNEPYQAYISNGYYEVIERPFTTYGGTYLRMTTKVLPKGQQYIINRLKKEA